MRSCSGLTFMCVDSNCVCVVTAAGRERPGEILMATSANLLCSATLGDVTTAESSSRPSNC